MAASCGKSDTRFPTDVGTTWTYSVRNGFGAEHVEDVRVARRLTVAGVEGFELQGPLGSTRMAWRSGTLWCESFANVSLRPPLPLWDPNRKTQAWKGTIETSFGEEAATARIAWDESKIEIDGIRFETMRTQCFLERPQGETQLTTWIAPGVGIVRQEQRTRDALDLSVEWVAGPKRGVNPGR